MTERPNQRPEPMRWKTGGKISRMRAMLAEAGQDEDVEADVLLHYMGLFNAMLGSDDANTAPLSVMFDTGPDIYKHDADGNLIDEEPGLIKYGMLMRCAAYEDLDQGMTKLVAQIKLHENDRTDFDFEGAYYAELASFDQVLSVNDLRLREIERLSLDPDTYSRYSLCENDRILEERLNSCARTIDNWCSDYLESDNEVPIATLLNCFIDQAEEFPDDQAEQYIEDQSTAFNLMVQGELRLIACCNGVVERLVEGTEPQRRVVQAIEMLVYAIDMAWKEGAIKGYLYAIDAKGNLVRCQLGTNAVDIDISEGGWLAEDYGAQTDG